MICLNQYRSRILKETNRNLGIFLDRHEVEPAHEFRVGVKRLTALYCFLNEIKPELDVKKLLKPYRSPFKKIGRIREVHIAIQLLETLDGTHVDESHLLLKALRARAKTDYRIFQKQFISGSSRAIRIPTIDSMKISERSILLHKNIVAEDLQSRITATVSRLNTDQWHRKRILLKRYHHTLDAFQFCPGQSSSEDELKRIKMLEQLLGDWHDRVTTIQILQSFPGLEQQTRPVDLVLKKQSRDLLGSAKIYLNKYAMWLNSR